MDVRRNSTSLVVLIIGDIVTFGIVTVFGFATHGELNTASARMLTTFLPLLLSWVMLVPFSRVYHLNNTGSVSDLWRPAWAMIIAAPLAGLLRALWLGTTIIPVFVVVLGGIATLAILCWRCIYWAIWMRRTTTNG